METVKLTPVTEALIQRVCDRIVAHSHPERIYLFGSAARGDVREGSDLDLLVVMELNEDERPYRKAAELHMLFRGWLVPLDIIVRTPEQFERGQRLPGFVERTAVREGRLIYEATV